MKAILPIILLILIFISCEVKPVPIAYGENGCTYCGMTIVDKQHVSQLVTSTGKAYNFDSIECLVNYHKENPDKEPGLLLVADYSNPGNLINANTATYLKSPNISSPMAANLSAFKDKTEGEKVQKQSEGQLYSWQELPGLLSK